MSVSAETGQLDEMVPASNEWEDDDLSLSSDFDIETIKIEEGGVHFEVGDTVHSNCVSRQVYEKEKKNWEEGINEVKRQMNEALNEAKNEAKLKQLESQKTFDKLQSQIVDLNRMLCDANDETEKYKVKLNEMEDRVQELEDKLYGPTNYYYKLYLETQDQMEDLKKEKDIYCDQLRQVKDILRNMIIDKSKAPTEEDLNRERQSFARDIAAYEKKINKLQEENDRLRDQLNK